MKNLEKLYQDLSTKWEMPLEEVKEKVGDYHDLMIKSLVDNGYVLINPDLRIDVIPTQPRPYVLKGKTYQSTRTYKLKASMGDPIYDKIKERYDQFREY